MNVHLYYPAYKIDMPVHTTNKKKSSCYRRYSIFVQKKKKNGRKYTTKTKQYLFQDRIISRGSNATFGIINSSPPKITNAN